MLVTTTTTTATLTMTATTTTKLPHFFIGSILRSLTFDNWEPNPRPKRRSHRQHRAKKIKKKVGGGGGGIAPKTFWSFLNPANFSFFSFFLSFLTGVHWLAVRSLYEAAAAAAVMRPKLSPPDYNNHPGQPLADHKVTGNVFATLITVSSNCRSTKLLEQNLSWNATYLPRFFSW